MLCSMLYTCTVYKLCMREYYSGSQFCPNFFNKIPKWATLLLSFSLSYSHRSSFVIKILTSMFQIVKMRVNTFNLYCNYIWFISFLSFFCTKYLQHLQFYQYVVFQLIAALGLSGRHVWCVRVLNPRITSRLYTIYDSRITLVVVSNFEW